MGKHASQAQEEETTWKKEEEKMQELGGSTAGFTWHDMKVGSGYMSLSKLLPHASSSQPSNQHSASRNLVAAAGSETEVGV